MTPALDDALRELAKAQRQLDNAQTVRDLAIKTEAPGLLEAVMAVGEAMHVRELVIVRVLLAYAAEQEADG